MKAQIITFVDDGDHDDLMEAMNRVWEESALAEQERARAVAYRLVENDWLIEPETDEGSMDADDPAGLSQCVSRASGG